MTVKNLTPPDLYCINGVACPAIYADERQLYVVGKISYVDGRPDIPVGDGEAVVTLPLKFKEMLKDTTEA